jgi:hypothetical protein
MRRAVGLTRGTKGPALKENIYSALVGTAIVLIAAAGTASAQVIDDVEELAWDRPEAWAMKYFSSVSLLTGPAPDRLRRRQGGGPE